VSYPGENPGARIIAVTTERKRKMRRLLTGLILAVIISTTPFISTASGQSVDKEGKAWLDACPDAAALNVTGLWKDPKWGVISLNQHQDSREVVGSGDGWDISGVVSGNSVCLLFSSHDRVAYSAKLTAEGAAQLSGEYVKGLLSSSSKTKPMRLVKLVK
jgi:hypothetical protein